MSLFTASSIVSLFSFIYYQLLKRPRGQNDIKIRRAFSPFRAKIRNLNDIFIRPLVRFTFTLKPLPFSSCRFLRLCIHKLSSLLYDKLSNVIVYVVLHSCPCFSSYIITFESVRGQRHKIRRVLVLSREIRQFK